jgi:hypothetical protein
LCCLAILILAGCDWTQLGFGPDNASNNGFEPSITPTSVAHLSVAWSQPCECAGRVLKSGGLVYAVDETGGATAVRVFDAATGTPGWSHTLSNPQLMAVGNGLVYIIVGVTVVALDAGTGSTRWTLTPPVPGTGTVTVTHLLVDGAMAFVDATSAIGNADPVSEISTVDPTGNIVWATTPGGQVGGFAGTATSSAPDSTARTLDVVSQLTVSTAPFSQFIVTQYDESGGSVLNRVLVAPGGPRDVSSGVADVSTAGGRVYFTVPGNNRGSGGLFAVDPATGALLWSGAQNDPYAAGTRVLVASELDRAQMGVEGLDPTTGSVLWGFTGDGGGTPAIAGGVVFTTASGVVQAINVANGLVAGTFSVPNEPFNGPVTPTAGRIYAGSTARLYALAPSST